MDTQYAIAKSWCCPDSDVNPTEELLGWIKQCNKSIQVEIHKIKLEDSGFWFYDREMGSIRNQNNSFFSIKGCQWRTAEGAIASQPVILQDEIGLLGIICQEIHGVIHFLMQAKIEPGNINKVQISPTIQATKSNFLQKHGGARPPYLDYFLNASQHEIIVDQLQSEQASRFIGKRNRNLLIRVEEPVAVLPSHRWMTLGQIKRLMREPNLINMDTRTVLSCIPYANMHCTPMEMQVLLDGFQSKALFRSVFLETEKGPFPEIFHYINHQKMFSDVRRQLVPLYQLPDWDMHNGEFVCRKPYPFRVIFCDIAIEGREVRHWTQPMFASNGSATFGLICCEDAGMLKFLVKAMPEVGCFDSVELGPTIQCEVAAQGDNEVTQLFWGKLEQGQDVMFDQMLSEEGGRFYQEQNRNVLLRVGLEELPPLPEGYFLLPYRTLNQLVQGNNILNIQLRNLLALLEA